MNKLDQMTPYDLQLSAEAEACFASFFPIPKFRPCPHHRNFRAEVKHDIGCGVSILFFSNFLVPILN